MLKLKISTKINFAIITILFNIFFMQNVKSQENLDQESDKIKAARYFIDDVGNKIIDIVSDKSINVNQARVKLIALIDSVIDVKWISRFILAKNYELSSKKQINKFEILYRDFMIQTYAPSFQGYGGEKFEVKTVLQKGKFFLVKCIFIAKDESSIEISFRLKEGGDNNFVVLDIIAQGVSLIQTQRSEFNEVIADRGMDVFLSELEQRVNKLRLSNNSLTSED